MRSSQDAERTINVTLAIAGLVIVVGGVAWLLMAIANGRDAERIDCGSYRFDRQAWLSEIDSEARLAQAERIAQCGVLVGKTRSDIRRALGAPRTHPAQSRDQLWYFVGSIESGYGIGDDQILKVSFDSEDVVSRVVFFSPDRLGLGHD